MASLDMEVPVTLDHHLSTNRALIDRVQLAVGRDSFWHCYLDENGIRSPPPVSIHLAVLTEPFLQYILDGKKTVESRFSVRQKHPFGMVRDGDILLLKKVGGPIVGLCRIVDVWSYHLDRNVLLEIQSQFAADLCAEDPEFWAKRSSAAFATVMRIQDVRNVSHRCVRAD
jgi:hypothetical protein